MAIHELQRLGDARRIYHVNDEKYRRVMGYLHGDYATALIAVHSAERDAQDRAGKIRTYTGRWVNPLRMRARDICVEDIAHHLSLICRYVGACPYHYSVAQHSVLVSLWLEEQGAPLALQLAGLLHDAGEYVFNDWASPVKKDPRLKWLRDLEHETTRLIFCVFGLDPKLLAMTKEADDTVFIHETRAWWAGGHDSIIPWRHGYAEDRFMARFYTLRGALNA